MTRRLVILLIVLTLGFASVYLLPASPELQASALPGQFAPETGAWELPHLVGIWRGGPPIEVSVEEVSVLAADTKFAKKRYVRNTPNASLEALRSGALYEESEVSIVTSGSDMSGSIHRPERCLRAQGFKILDSQNFMVKVRGMPLPVTKLVTSRTHVDPEDNTKAYTFHNVTYYWFVGHSALTNDHYQRTLLDMKDRLLKGYDQEWAYATVGIMLEPHQVLLEKGRPGEKPVVGLTHPIDNLAKDAQGMTEADRIAQEFIEDLAKDTIDRRMIDAWNKPVAQL